MKRRLYYTLLLIVLLASLVFGVPPAGQPAIVHAAPDTVTIKPNGAGDATGLTDLTIGGSTPAATNWESVDDPTADDDVTFVYSTNTQTYEADLYNLADTALSGTINSVTVWIRCKSLTAPTQESAYFMIKTNGVAYDTSATPILLDTVWTDYSTVYNTNPQTTAAWTWAEVNALQAGVALRQPKTTGGNRDSQCTMVWVVIDYTVVTPPTVTTQDATNVATTTATGNGTITATGGENATRRGFCYMVGTSGDPTTADSVAYDDGSFTTGAYTKEITGLTPGTNYRVRAYAVNSAGTGYGTTVQMTTLAAPDISNTPATWNFGVVDASSSYTTGLSYVADTSGFRITNNTSYAVKITISAGNMTGGDTWTLADDGTPDATHYALKAGTPGLGDYTITVTSGGVTLVDSIAGSGGTQDWGLKLMTPTAITDGAEKSGTVTLTATAA